MRTKLIATLGPASSNPNVIRGLVRAGASAFRLNFSHGSYEEQAHRVLLVRDAEKETGRHLAVIQDLQGPKLRITSLADDEVIPLTIGKQLTIGAEGISFTDQELILPGIESGQRVLLDDAKLELVVDKVWNDSLLCTVTKGGELLANKGISFPGTNLPLPGFTDKDKADLDFGLDIGVDWIAMSFVRGAEDVLPIRQAANQRGFDVPVYAKIERREAIEHLEEIACAFDGVLVARGDLGQELALEDVPLLQKRVVALAQEKGKPSMVATQMLDSMIHNPSPTLAEVSDVANAALDGVDALLLSGETAAGEYPVESVETMARIVERVEYHVRTGAYPGLSARSRQVFSVSELAAQIANDRKASALVAVAVRGACARQAATTRPVCQLVAITPSPEVARQLAPIWGVVPLVAAIPDNTDEAIRLARQIVIERGLVGESDEIAYVGSSPFTAQDRPNFIASQGGAPIALNVIFLSD